MTIPTIAPADMDDWEEGGEVEASLLEFSLAAAKASSRPAASERRGKGRGGEQKCESLGRRVVRRRARKSEQGGWDGGIE